MHDPLGFRTNLGKRLLGIVALSALAGCPEVIPGGSSSGTGTMNGTQCFAWPPDGGLGGGSAGAGGTGGTAGATGGGAGSEPNSCPAAADAAPYMQTLGCNVISVDGPATFNGTQCCYPVTESCGALTGRPFLVGGAARTANAATGSDSGWSAAVRPSVDRLAEDARSALRDAWLRDALGEHASVASFARVALELLAIGAPADLLDEAHRAACDEVRHARLCFALASAYAGHEVAPGPFPFGGAVAIDTNLARFAARAVAEGCVGETLAAIRASEQLAAATDPAVVNVLEQIATDEARHAELAWRAVAWAIRVGGESVRAAVAEAFEAAARIAEPTDDVPAHLAEAMTAHGRVSEAQLRETLELALHDVVLPAAAALVSGGDRRGPVADRVRGGSEARRA